MRLAGLLLLASLAGCAETVETSVPPQPAGAPPISTIPLASLPGWTQDNAAAALTAFVSACGAIIHLPADQSLGGIGIAHDMAGQAGDLLNACQAARAVLPGDQAAARQFFNLYFAAYRLDQPATITGYFEPEYPGTKNSRPGFKIPLYAEPADPALQTLTRADIDHNALYRKAPVTAYVATPVDAFMLQTEGSGRILLPNGETLRVGFDGQTTAPFTPIGRLLVNQGQLQAGDVSFQSISNWLQNHPDEAVAEMEQNKRYVFLKPLGNLPDDEGAPGTLGVPLQAGRTVAVDRSVIPLGLPVYLATTNPVTGQPIDRLTVAVDSGEGIKGAGADLFFGAGPTAEDTAGRMHQAGTLYLLLPRPSPTS
jgi:membrane-bound lytic murein transglycosylase A